MDPLRLRSHAKINLSLKILGLREDRYHEIDSRMQSISLHDDLELIPTNGDISVECDSPEVPAGEGNIAHRAARQFLNFVGSARGVNILIKKNIPVSAGLAGGSSNAAAVIYGCDRIFRTGLSTGQLMSLAADVGSDVPFCLVGGTCRVRGRGEVVEPMPALPATYFVLVVPDVSVPTKWAYEEYDRWSMRKKGTIRHLEPPDSANDTFLNDFEEAITLKFPEIKAARQALVRCGAIAASMSGSGPSVFGLVQDESAAAVIVAELREKFPRTYAVRTVDSGVSAA